MCSLEHSTDKLSGGGDVVAGGSVSGASVVASVSGAAVDGGSVAGAAVDGGSVAGAAVDGGSVAGAAVDGGSVGGSVWAFARPRRTKNTKE